MKFLARLFAINNKWLTYSDKHNSDTFALSLSIIRSREHQNLNGDGDDAEDEIRLA